MKVLNRTLFLILLVVLWEMTCRVFNISSFLFPSPTQVFAVGVEKYNTIFFHTRIFLFEVFLGFVFSIFIGYILAMMSAIYKPFDDVVTPIIMFFQGVPKLAIAPFILIFFGFGLWPKVFISTMMGFLGVYLGTLKGMKSVDVDIMEIAVLYNANKWQVMKKIRIPSSIPDFFSGLKISIPSILGGVVIGEFMVGNVGLAYLVFATAMSFDVALSFASVIVLSLIGVFLFKTVCYIEKKYNGKFEINR